jgi:hypothetical protein
MADYYPLLSRAIAGLASQPDVSHDAIYNRAREALERQLRGFEPKLEEEAILAELAALEETIARVEKENSGKENSGKETVEPEKLTTTSAPEPSSGDITTSAPESSDFTADEAPPVAQPMVRPRMPERVENPGRKKTLALFSGIAVVAMLVMGLIAVSKRDTAQLPAAPPVVKAPEAATDASKTEGRLSGTDAGARAVEPATPTEVKPAPDIKPDAAKVLAPAAGRAFMVLEAQASGPSQFEGKVSWSFAPDPAIKGQKALRALIGFDNAGLSVDFSIARNTDPKLNASHTVMVIFEPKNGIGNVREMSAVEWREHESQTGVTLAGIVVPVQDNIFMIGLDQADAARARNLDLLRTQKWMVFEIRLESGRRGAILVEKGTNGDKAVSDALASWK